MRKLLLVAVMMLSGCSTIEKIQDYWPKAHDPVMFEQLVKTSIAIDNVNCEKPDWTTSSENARVLQLYTEWRRDPQRINIKGLYDHTIRMSKGGSKTFCEIGKKTAQQRIQAAKTAWEGR